MGGGHKRFGAQLTVILEEEGEGGGGDTHFKRRPQWGICPGGGGGQLPGAVNTVVRMPKRGACRGAGRLEWSQRDRLMYNVRRATAPEQGADPPRESRAQQVYTGRVCTILNCPTMQNSTCVWGALYNLRAAPHNPTPPPPLHTHTLCLRLI